jgi:hypothetical protein
MRRRILTFFCLAACFAIVPAFAQQQGGADPITGKWSGDWGPSRVVRHPGAGELKNARETVTGTVNSEGKVVQIKNGSFDAKTNAFHMEADSPGPGDRIVHFVIDGKLENNTLAGSWNHDVRKGDFKITKE